MKDKISYPVTCALCAVLVSGAYADGIKTGPGRLRPYVDAKFVHDDNVFQSNANEDEDYYLDYSVGAKYIMTERLLLMTLDGWFAQRKYDEFDRKDANRWGETIALEGGRDRLYWSAMENIREVEDYDNAPAYGTVPGGFEGTLDKSFDRTSSADKRRLSDAVVSVGSKLTDKSSLQVAYSYYGVDYDTRAEDWDENSVGMEGAYLMTDKTAMFVNLQGAVQDGDGAPEDAIRYLGRVGVKNSLTDKSTLRAGIGVEHYSYDTTTGGKDETAVSYEARLLWAATDKVSVFVSGRNEIQPTGTKTETQVAFRNSAGVSYRPTDVLSLTLTGTMAYEKYNDAVLVSGVMMKPESTDYIVTARVNYAPSEGFNLYGQLESTTAQADLSDDYDRLRATIGLRYIY